MKNYLDILHSYFGYSNFRGIQKDIIESIGKGKDTLGLMPTGGGKSITFQVPALATDGVCIVITPLIALMKDQVMHLRKKGIQASAIYSGMSRHEVIVTLENCIFGGIKILYISPERLSSELFQAKLKHINVSFITVDEAHCISQWGYDFRPSYLNIANIRKLKPNIPILALTATATSKVVDDIQEKLCFKEKNVFQMSFERKNLAYIVRKTLDKNQELIHILNSVKGSAIIYVRSRKHSKEIAKLLTSNSLDATFFHAGLDSSVKDQRQEDWQNDKTRIIVATNAFGMGIDKSDVRLVIHYDCPDSIEAYFQEAGRAGRDGNKAYAVMLYNNSDKRKLEKRIIDNFPEKDYIKDVYERLAYYYQIGIGSGYGHTFEFDIDKFCHAYKYFPIQVDSSLKILQKAGYIVYEADPNASARVMFLLKRNELYRLESTTPHEEATITALLRNYGGLFTDYSYIDEAFIAQQAGLNVQQIYLILKGLSQRHIIHFIPKRKTPFITYTANREEKEHIVLSKEIYEDRKQQFIERIHAIEAYATNEDKCRSRLLLEYFNEKKIRDCKQCDVCIEHHSDQLSANRIKRPKELILSILKDGKKHSFSEIQKLNIPERQLDGILQQLITEEEIGIDSSEIYKT